MRSKLAFVLLMSAVAAPLALAQEPAVEAEVELEEPVEPAFHIRVLEDPYDIASFYRSNQAGAFGAEPARRGGNVLRNPYAIAGYYRGADGPRVHPYEAFWTRGYGSARQDGLMIGYRRRIGENGDLYLLAPTFLAHVGPLSGFFLVDR